jgi:hypothetical protein
MGTEPIFSEISGNFEEILNVLRMVDGAFRSQRFRTDTGGNALGKLISAVEKVQQTIRTNEEAVSEIRRIANLTQELFDHALPLYFRQASEQSWYRAQIIGKCAEIKELVLGAAEFEQIVAGLKSAAIVFNREFGAVQGVLNLPFAIEVTVAEPSET